jgi:hypothetical protein
MSETVRFYWRGGEAEIPLTEIPEQDSQPLRVRRSVVQARAPVVVQQLEAGRFVAAAWEAGGQISLIGCHPNLAKGSADTLIVNTAALPQVVVRFGGWGEAPEIARLFLTAFGSEAASAEECAAARRALAEWLAKHGQSEMAAVVRHFFAFPFGVRSDALEVINTWRNVRVQGPKGQIQRFLTEVSKRFEALGWSREANLEAQLTHDGNRRHRLYGWINSPGSKPHVVLFLCRETDRRVRGDAYKVLDQGTSITDLADIMQYALAEAVEPAAAAAGLEVAYPRLGPISRVGPRTAAALEAFAEAADGQWPLPEGVEPTWRQVVITAVREGAALHPEELSAWLVASGWEPPAAAELMRQFYADAAFLEEYEDGRQPA